MKQLVGDGGFGRLVIGIEQLAAGGLDGAAVGGGRGVFHGPTHVVAHGYLGIFLPGVIHTQLFGEEIQHFGRVTEHGASSAGVLRLHIVIDGLTVPGVIYHRKITDDYASEVRGVGLTKLPSVGTGTISISVG